MTAHKAQHETGADYLWDRTGAADADIARLERSLSALRYRSAPLSVNSVQSPARGMMIHVSRRVPLRAAAALALLISGVWAVSLFSTAVKDAGAVKTHHNTMAAAGALEIMTLDGRPRVAGQTLQGGGALRAGQWLETDATSQAEIDIGGFGTVKVEPDSRLRLVRAAKNEQRLELAQGAVTALISAPPRLFVIDTPAATAFDLGCAYRMTVDESGDGMIHVTMGWVSMEAGEGREPSIVPWGAMCVTRKGLGVGTPFYEDASAALRRALQRFDFENGGAAALQTVLYEAREDDSLTLWHLLARTSGENRGRVFDRLASLAPPPDGVTRERITRGDMQAQLAWRDTFIWSPSPPTSRVP